MYENCLELKSFQNDYFNFNRLLTLEGMFNTCEKITEVSFADVSNLYINSIQGLFAGCVNLLSVDFGKNFSNEKLFNVSTAFKNCARLKAIKNINSIFNQNTTQIQDLFLGCERLPKLDLNLSTVAISDYKDIFNDCKRLKKLRLKISRGINCFYFLFRNCWNLSNFTVELNREERENKREVQDIFVDGKMSNRKGIIKSEDRMRVKFDKTKNLRWRKVMV